MTHRCSSTRLTGVRRVPGHRHLTACGSLVGMSIPYGYPGSSQEQFEYDETMLAQGRYREWFWNGLQESQVAYLRQPARVDKVEQEPVGYDGWETAQPRRWEQEADCAGAGPEIFFNSGNQPKAAYLRRDAKWREYCPQCPVRDTCLAVGRESGSVGIWGGVYRYSPRNSSNLKDVEELDDRIPTRR